MSAPDSASRAMPCPPPPPHDHSSRTVGGVLLAGVVSTLALTLRVLANIARRMSRVLITLYDVVIVLPLLAERMTKAGMAMRHGIDADDSAHQTR